ncbi:hypothetical protein XhhCFBP4925_22790 [Xanthomonas hortorum pv. hederae]|nr:hypothetical protein XhhCFBP4925_22790 [Xanthomonas hortorum pv. hederae]
MGTTDLRSAAILALAAQACARGDGLCQGCACIARCLGAVGNDASLRVARERNWGFAVSLRRRRTLTPTPAPRPSPRLRRGRTNARVPVARKPCLGAPGGEGLETPR